MKLNDENFIEYFKQQEEDALEFIVDKYLPLVKGVTYKILASPTNKGAIEECINDVLDRKSVV